MASDEYGDKTEQPTDRKRSDAREKGNVARSVEKWRRALTILTVIPTKVGIQKTDANSILCCSNWIPVFTGMTSG